MIDLIDLYRTQLRVLWHWNGGPRALIRRGIRTVVVAAASFAMTAWLLPGIILDSLEAAFNAVILIALFNVLIRSVVLAIVASFSLILTGIVVLVFQVVAFLGVATLAPGVHVNGFWTALVGSFVYAIVNTILTSVLGIDRGGSYYGQLVRSLLLKGAAAPSDRPGLVVIQIDGLAYPILASRIRAGSVNTIAGWVRDRTHLLSPWEATLPSMTSASQGGILHGSSDGIPAFRWYERDRQRLMVSSHPADAAEIETRLSDGEGLLSNNGASIGNLLTGDATRAYLTSAALDRSQGIGERTALARFFFSPTGYLRSLVLFLGEMVTELIQAARTRRSGIRPQLDRGVKYAAIRAASNVLLREMNVSLIIEEMYRGANIIYADFTDYDEIAHHSGPERVEALQALDGIDGTLATIVKASEDAPRPYQFVVLSDHGQSLGATFLQRYGKSLDEVVLDLMGSRPTVIQSTTPAEGSTFVNSLLSEVTRGPGVGPSVARAALASRTTDGIVDLDREAGPAASPSGADLSTIVVVGSGNLGLVYFTGHDHRLTAEELEAIHPNLVASLAAHPGVAMLMVRSAAQGAVVFGPRGARYLDQDRVLGEDPTTVFGPHTVISLKREDAMTHAPDLLLISQYDPELGEVAAFEELIGSHGGLGGPQTQPFILHPVAWELDDEVPLGAPAIYHNIRRWLASIGIDLGVRGAAAESSSAAPGSRGIAAAPPSRWHLPPGSDQDARTETSRPPRLGRR